MIDKQEIQINATYALFQDGTRYRIQVKIDGVKSWYAPQGPIDLLFGRARIKPWETRFRWLAERHLGLLRSREADRIADKNAVWESVREVK